MYRDCLAAGAPVTDQQLGAAFGLSDRWGRDRIAEVRADGNGAADVTHGVLDDHDEAERPWTPRMSITLSGSDDGGMTPARLRSLPVTFPFDPVVPQAFGISRSAAYRALAAGQLPITPLRLGRKLIVRRADLLAALGIDDEPGDGK